LILAIIPFAFAATFEDVAGYKESVIPKGEDGVASLPLFSKTYIRLYEGTSLDFNVVDPDTGAILIRNNMEIKEIGNGFVNVDLSLDGKSSEAFTFKLGEKNQLNFSNYKFMPYMRVTNHITNYEAKYPQVVLYFDIPFIKQMYTDQKDAAFIGVDRTIVGNKATTSKFNTTSIIVSLSIVIVILLLASLFYYRKKRNFKK
jgi:hypothetical protein